MSGWMLASVLFLPAAEAAPTPGSPPAPAPATTPATPPARLVMQVLLANDADFPPVTARAAEAILREARATLADKLGFADLDFRITGTTSVADFISRHAPGDDACSQELEPLRVLPGVRRATDADVDRVQRFLSRWSVESLRAFFPEVDRAALTSYTIIRDKLLEEFDRKVAVIASFTLAKGRSLLSQETLDQRSYVRWICAMRNQDEADLVLTNAFILYDLSSEPYPHAIFAKGKVGGASLLSPKRRAIRQRAVVASTFSMVTDIPFFLEEGADTLTPDEKLAVIGTFIVAHELGHAVFKIPDFYDHPPECLMTTKYETGYVSGYRVLKTHPGACSACQPYVDAKRFVFRAEAYREAGLGRAAADELKLAIQKTPKHVDGTYKRYIAELSLQVAEAYAAAGDRKEAQRWLKSVLRVAPDYEEAKRVEAQMPAAP